MSTTLPARSSFEFIQNSEYDYSDDDSDDDDAPLASRVVGIVVGVVILGPDDKHKAVV